MLFVPRPDSYERCFCVCVCSCHPHHNFVKPNDSIPHFLRIPKTPAQHIKRRYNIIIEPDIGSYIWERLFSHFAACDTPGISSLPHPEGEPCTTMCQIYFFAHRHLCLFRPRVVSRALGCGARKRPASTLPCERGP